MQVLLKSKLTDALLSQQEKPINGRNAFPGSEQGVHLKKDPTTGKFITGYNLELGESEEAILKDKKHPKHNLMIEKQQIETALGQKLDGDINNEFLLYTRILLCDRAAKARTFNLDFPLDRFHWRALISAGFAAPSYEEIKSGKYQAALYYFSESKKEESSRQEVKKMKNKLAAKLEMYEDNKLWLLSIANKLGLKINPDISSSKLYTLIDEYKDGLTSLESVKTLKQIFEMALQELEVDFLVDVSIKNFFIESKNSEKYINGQFVGNTIEEVKTNLQKDLFDESLAYLRERVNKKYKI